MNYKPGQRVKKVAMRAREDRDYKGRPSGVPAPIGSEGVVVKANPEEAFVKWDRNTESGWNMNYMIAPLTDPGADAFMERIKKLKPYDEPKVPERINEFQ